MESIKHTTVSVNGIQMHVAEKGQGPVILFLHGFPDLWYTWRHQLLAFSSLGYRAVAPDLRGYGDTDAPPSPQEYTCHHLVGDIVGLIEWLGEESVYLVAHDWGAWLGWYLCMFRPDKVKAFVCLTVPFRPRHHTMKPLQLLRGAFGEDYYMCRFQEPGNMESQIAHSGTAKVLHKVFTNRNTGPPILPKSDPFRVSSSSHPLPSWLTQQDIQFYAQKFEEKGFTGGLNYYRAIDSNWELTAPWTGAKVKVATKFIVGDMDLTYTTPGVKEYIHNGGFKKDVPLLDEEIVVMEGVGHFINQEKVEDTNAHILAFLNRF
jgi:pimeloyl-ACP methyl ester carboxylesterase